MNNKIFSMMLNSDKKLISREWNTQRILEIRLQAPAASRQNGGPRLNLALVLDRSGSMQGQKLEYVKQAACHVLDQLTEHDRVALVVYDDVIRMLAPSTPITNDNRFELKGSITGLRAGNMTNLCDGWLTGCKEIASAAQDGTLNRTLLLTDGLANVGVTDPERIAAHSFELYKDSVSTSTFGVGEGFNEHLLEAMANRGGGNFYFIPNPDDIPGIFMKEFDGLVGITVRNVELKLALPKSVEWQVLGGWSAEYKKGYLHIYVGDMPAEKLQDLYVKLQIPKDEKSADFSLDVRAFGRDQDANILEDSSELSFQYALLDDLESEPVNREVMERYSLVELADETTKALKLERDGFGEEAEKMVAGSVQSNLPYLSPQDAAHYKAMSRRMKVGMTEADRKLSHWESYNIKRRKPKEDKKEKH